jgi:tetratricopeptide (TPR) repeat protein
MCRLFSLILLFGCLTTAVAQDSSLENNQTPPRSARDKEAGESSSRDTRIDLSPPKDDAKDHPNSAVSLAGADEDDASADIQEFHPWDPHKAMKDIEVGDFYFKKKNYRAALGRYREALVYKPNDALANFHMAQCLEKLDKPDEARSHFEEYLKITPHGPLAREAKAALEKLKQGENKDQVSQKAH